MRIWDNLRAIAGLLATITATALACGLVIAAGAGPASAEPTIRDVRVRVDQLYHEAEQASERYNDARIQLRAAKDRLRVMNGRLARSRATVAQTRDQVAASVVAQYEGQALAATSQVLLARSPASFLDRLTILSQLAAQRSEVTAALAAQSERLDDRAEAALTEVARVDRTRRVLASEKARIDEKAAAAERLLDRLEEEARERLEAASRSGGRVPLGDVAATGRAAAAVAFAMAQVGDAYIYGAAGPSAYDCSGLTMSAWGAAGVGLPHSSSAQRGSGTPVSSSALQPGDLVFYYSPVSHVGMYIGNGMIVHAANPSTGVEVAPMYSMPYSGAVRPG